MPAKAPEPLRRTHIWFYASDWADLEDLFGAGVGISNGVRRLVRMWLNMPPDLRKELWELYKNKGELG